MNEKKLLSNIAGQLEPFRESPFLFLVRARGMELVGIITKVLHKYDHSWGVMRLWAVGVTVDGKKFEEPLDRKNRRTGELEDIIQIKNDFLVVTARSSSSLDDDDDENFQYFLNPHTVNEIKDRLDEIKEKNRIIRDLNNRLQAEIKKREHHQSEAEAYGSEAKSLREKVSNLLMRLSLAENRAEYYKNMLKERYTERIEEEGYLEEKMKGASKRGELLGKDSADVIVEAATKQAEAKKKLDEIGAGSFTEYATKTDVRKMKEEIINLLKNLTPAEKESPGEEHGEP